MPSIFPYLTSGAVDSTFLLFLIIALCAVFLEDATIVVVGVLAADGLVSVPIAFLALFLGICIGDAALYALGAFARTHPRLAHYIEHDFTAPFRLWLTERYGFKVFSAHFVPGLRFTSYVASGFFRLPFSTYISMALAGALVLETTLFTFSYWFGSFTSKWVGEARWGIAAVILVLLFFIGKRNLLSYRERKNGA